jgi:F-type H+-transporting ATPase subunit a
MTAGHTVISIMLFFVITLPWFAGWLPLGFAILISGAEIFIGAIQAYIFTILTCVYINDALHMH